MYDISLCARIAHLLAFFVFNFCKGTAFYDIVIVKL